MEFTSHRYRVKMDREGLGGGNRAHGSSQIDESEKAPTMSGPANDVEEAPPRSQH
jgi:hypothetical protein